MFCPQTPKPIRRSSLAVTKLYNSLAIDVILILWEETGVTGKKTHADAGRTCKLLTEELILGPSSSKTLSVLPRDVIILLNIYILDQLSLDTFNVHFVLKLLTRSLLSAFYSCRCLNLIFFSATLEGIAFTVVSQSDP